MYTFGEIFMRQGTLLGKFLCDMMQGVVRCSVHPRHSPSQVPPGFTVMPVGLATYPYICRRRCLSSKCLLFRAGTIHSDQNKQSGETAEIGSAHIESSQRPTRGRGRGRGRGTQLSLTPTHSHPLHGNLQGNNFLPRGNRPTLFHNDISQHNNESGFEQRYPAPGGPRFGSDLGCNVPPMFAPNFPPGAQSRHPEPFNGPRFRSQRAQFSPTLPRPPHDQMFRGRVHHPGYQLPGVPIHGPHPPMFDPTVPPPALNSMPPHFDSSIPPPGTLPSSFDAAVLPPVSGKARPIFDPSIPPPSVPPNMPPFNWQPPT